MRSVDIVFENRRVLPGDTLSGKVVIRTDEPFDCNRVVLKFKSRERTQHGSGDNRRVDTKNILSRVFRISEGKNIPAGNSAIPFSFQVPKGIPPSFQGYHGDIKHTIEAVVEIDWALDPKLKLEYTVIQHRPPYIPVVGDTRVLSKEDDGLHVRLDSDVLRMDTGIFVRFEVEQKKRMRRVRIDIRKRQEAKCGWNQLSHESNVRREYVNLGEEDWGRWKECTIGENWKYHLPFSSQLFRVGYYLQVTLEVGWDIDPSLRFPLTFSDNEPEKDVLDEIAMDLGLEEW